MEQWFPKVKAKQEHVLVLPAGVGLKFNINKYWAIDVEARGAIAPSILR